MASSGGRSGALLLRQNEKKIAPSPEYKAVSHMRQVSDINDGDAVVVITTIESHIEGFQDEISIITLFDVE